MSGPKDDDPREVKALFVFRDFFTAFDSVIVRASKASDTKSAPRTYVDRLLENIQNSGDFLDDELADNIEQAEKDLRKNFRLRSD